MLLRPLCPVSIAVLALGMGVFADDLTGPVTSVLDGDTLEVLHNQRPEHILLSRIACPERSQAYGKHSKHAASTLVFGKEVIVRIHGKDKYKRTIADVILPDGTNVNHTLVKLGWCWCYPKYEPGDTVLEGLEMEAREGRRALSPLVVTFECLRFCTRVFSGSMCHTRPCRCRGTPNSEKVMGLQFCRNFLL